MIRKVLVAPDGAVLDYRRFEEEELDTAALAAWLWGDAEPPEGALDPAMGDERGTVLDAPDDQPIGVGWTWDGERFVPPDMPPPVLTAKQFRDLFTAETRIKLRADPVMADAELDAMAQDDIDLASPRLKQLMDYAVGKKLLARAEADAVLAGKPPG